MNKLRQILEMIRFSHTIFALPFALLAAVMAWLTPTESGQSVPFRWSHLLGILICMVTARSAAMAFNRIVDRHLDAENPRTANRHLPRGDLRVGAVKWFTAAMSLAFVAGTLLFLPNWLPLLLAVPVLLFLFGYSYAKRFTSFPHFWLGVSLFLTPVSAWIALRGEVMLSDPFDVVPAVITGIAVLLWVAGFDIIYACQDIDYDRGAKLRSVPTRLGVHGALRLAAVCHAGMVCALIALPLSSTWWGPPLELGWIYWIGIAVVAGMLIYEHGLVRPDDLTRVNLAFFQVNAMISMGLFAIVTVDLLW